MMGVANDTNNIEKQVDMFLIPRAKIDILI